MPVGTYNVTDMVELKRERLLEVSTHYVRCTRKTLFLTTFFINWPRGSPQKVIRRAKWDQRVAPLSVALGLTLNWLCPLGIRHCQSCSFGFFRSFDASLKSKRQRAFLDFGDRYAHQTFGTNVNFCGGCEKATTFWLGFRDL